ncbi:replicative DNA helicase [Streptomyces sp. NPDC056632]|uniref:replicative DNA helicase n=1 Tax=Streptomyces sp. NPDC056632 TaxID=3345884 RepID=UPI0036BB8CD1
MEEDQRDEAQSLEEALEAAFDRVEVANAAERTVVGLSMGFRDLDELTGGLLGGTLTVVAARPAMGRSTFVRGVCERAALTARIPTLHISLEHAITETTLRLISSRGRIPLHHMRTGAMTDDDWKRFELVTPKIANAPLYFWSPTRVTMAQLATRAREDVELRDIGLIAVDGIQDIRPEKRSDLREREVGDIVRDLKALARELDIPVVVSSHLNRGAETRPDRMPTLDDLRESGAITYAADTIILLHRPDAYGRETPRAGEADLIVAKHRDGPTARFTCAFQGHYSRFVEMACP